MTALGCRGCAALERLVLAGYIVYHAGLHRDYLPGCGDGKQKHLTWWLACYHSHRYHNPTSGLIFASGAVEHQAQSAERSPTRRHPIAGRLDRGVPGDAAD